MPIPSLADRFQAAVAELTGALPTPKNRLGVAVSGGPDSVALLSLSAQSYPGAVAAATVNHGLRPEATEEANHVAAICAQFGIPHIILRPEQPITGNIQSAARTARYGLLEAWRDRENLQCIATAHHADDQFETIVMRLMRGSGIDGLSAIRPVNGRIIRPLLGVRKADLLAHVTVGGLETIDDPSNRDDAFDRVRLRKILGDLPDFDTAALGRSITAAREASEALQWMAEKAADTYVGEANGQVILTHSNWPDELLRRLVIICLDRVDPGHNARGSALDLLIGSLKQGEKGMIGKILCAAENPESWLFSMAPPRKTR